MSKNSLWTGFGFSHSLGVAVGLHGYGMCKMRRAIRKIMLIFSFSGSRMIKCPAKVLAMGTFEYYQNPYE
jgi:hypothetical protein